MLVIPPRSVALIGAVCVTVGWLLASTLTPPVARVQTRPERRPEAAPSPITLAPFTERLHVRLQQAPMPPTPRRNPFVFGSRRPSTSPDVAAIEPKVAVEEISAPVQPVSPTFQLSGIGVSGDVRTAILSDGNSVVLAKIGDVVGAYTVAEISDVSATLTAPTGERHVLRLR